MASKIVRCAAPCGCLVDVLIDGPELSRDDIENGHNGYSLEDYGAAVSMVDHHCDPVEHER